VRAHPHFRLGANQARPLILVGNGTGIAGLRAHLKSRIDDGQVRNWLLFGERNAAHDQHYRAELAGWHAGGQLARLDLAFSRDQEAPCYVQHLLEQQAERLREWVGQGAAIYVCGSLQGMAAGVHAALVAALGEAQVEALAVDGRYRRDVY
jgi:sulfite reductase (NADPH) flavoprotein alpha-component